MESFKELTKLPRSIWIMALATMINRMGAMALPFLVLFLTKQKNLTTKEAGELLAIYGIAAVIIGPLGGKLSDRIGAYKTIILTLLLSGLTVLFYPFLNGYWVLALATSIWALCLETFRPANQAIVSELVEPEQQRVAFSLIRLAINVGFGIGPALGGYLAYLSYNSIFMIQAVSSFIVVLILIYFKSLFPIKNQNINNTQAKTALQNPLLSKPFLYFLIGVLPVSTVFFQHEGALPLFIVKVLEMPEYFYGLIFSINTLLIVIFEVPLTVKIQNWSFKSVFTLGSFLFALGFGVLAFTNSIAGVYFSVVIWTIGEMILFPAFSAYVAANSPSSQRGEYMGYYSTFFNLGSVIGPYYGTLLLNQTNSQTLWLSVFICGILSVIIFWFHGARYEKQKIN